jgi:hypothetical protein
MRVDEGGGSAQVAQESSWDIGSAVTSLKAASADGFTVSDKAGQPLLNALRDAIDEVDLALRQMPILATQRPLGLTPGAQVYAPFLASVATDPTQGAVPALTKLKKDLVDAHAEITKSLASYQTIDGSAASDFGRK